MCLGVIVSMRKRSRTWPLFVTDELHQYTVLVFFVFLVLHVVTVLLDPFTKFGIQDVLVPFLSGYRRVWMGLGVLAADLALALAIAGWLRRWTGYAVFRFLHYATYVIFPLAMVHAIATGSDTKNTLALAFYGACLLAVLVTVSTRVFTNAPAWRWLRPVSFGAAAIAGLALVAWLPNGPLGADWVRASGTPVDLLATASPAPASADAVVNAAPFTDTVAGTVSRSTQADYAASGTADGAVALTWSLQAQANGGSSVTGTLDIATAAGASVCSATVTQVTTTGFIATCTPAGSQKGLTFQLNLSQGRGRNLAGQLVVSSGAPGTR